MSDYIRGYESITNSDISLVGGKNASLGELYAVKNQLDIHVPSGFAVTTKVFDAILNQKNTRIDLQKILQDSTDLATKSALARKTVEDAGIPNHIQEEIVQAYQKLSHLYEQFATDVAVRSSATAEDLTNASFAGQQESFLNVHGEKELLDSCLRCFSSLYTERAIHYRKQLGLDDRFVKISVGIQKMVRSDLACSGVIFTLDPETGFKNTILISSSYGLGENIVGGVVEPDEFLIFKPALRKGFQPILRRKIGSKAQKLVYSFDLKNRTENICVPDKQRSSYSLMDSEIILLSKWALELEDYYDRLYQRKVALDIEWAKDGRTGEIFIVQARPETVFSDRKTSVLTNYELKETGSVLLEGKAVGNQIAVGPVHLISTKEQLSEFKSGEVLVAEATDPDWEPVMKVASAIVTNSGGRTCHAAIVSRELGIPCIVGTKVATEILKNGDHITVSCAEGQQGKVYLGKLTYEKHEQSVSKRANHKTQIMLNLGNPDQAIALAQLPVDGVGLVRQEFIIANEVRVHPLALTRFERITDAKTREAITQLTCNYSRMQDYYIQKLAEGISTIAAAFHPRPVIVRLSDFKTNEYANLLGGSYFEPKENNPMIGFRGASRYYDNSFKDGFALECQALKTVRDDMGFTNVKVMVPFCRTIEEALRVLEELSANGLHRGENGLELYLMCEIPSNVLLADQFAQYFDGFSIGSNDLTQLTLGVDRDSALVASCFDEMNPAVLQLIASAIKSAKINDRKIGICGQAPSDHPEMTRFLIEQGIDSISVSSDALFKTIETVEKFECEMKMKAEGSLQFH